MKHLSRLFFVMLCAFSLVTGKAAAAEQKEATVDVKEIVLGHMGDAYEWHITTWNGHHVSIPLPVIVRAENGSWHVFSSSRFHESTDGTYEGFYLNEEQNGKIYEHLSNGQDVRPLDLSITKDVVQIWIVVILMAVIFIGSARWYKGRKRRKRQP